MKRLPALLLTLLLLASLSTSALAASSQISKEGSTQIPVTLFKNEPETVDVTITWEDLAFTYDGNKFTTTTGGTQTAKITVENHTAKAVNVEAKYAPAEQYQDRSIFDLRFLDAGNLSNAGELTFPMSVANGNAEDIFVAPKTESTLAGLANRNTHTMGNVVITIAVP